MVYKLDVKNENIRQCIVKMSNRIACMYDLAIEAMQSNDVDKALKVMKMDEFVNAAEEEINQMAIESLALLSPVAKDLRVEIAAIKIASELERIGDYAKSVASFIIKNGQVDEELCQLSSKIVDAALVMLDHAMEAYVNKDADQAMIIPEEDDLIDDVFDEVIALLKKRLVSQQQIELLIPAVGMMRNLERAGDHITNICEHIVFENKGQYIEFS